MEKLESFIYWILTSEFRKKMVIILTILAFFASLLMFPSGGVLARMLPGKSATTYSIYVDTPTGSSIQQTKKVTGCVANILREEDEILDISIYYGQGIPLDYAGLVKGSLMKRSENVAELSINLTPNEVREEASFLMISRLRPIVQETCQGVVPGSVIKFIEQPSGPPTLAQIVVEVHGEGIPQTRKLSVEVANILANTKDLVDVDIMADDIYEKYQLVPDIEKIAVEKLGIEQVNNILYLAFEGMVIATKNSANRSLQIPIYLVLSDETKRLKNTSYDAIRSKLSSLTLMNRQGLMIPLTEVVKIVKVNSNPTIMHKDLKRMINVIAETDNVSQVYPLLDARAKMKEHFSDQYHVTTAPISTYMFDLELEHKRTGDKYLLRWDGEMKVTLDTFRDLGAAFIAALVLIFFLLVIYYKSFALSGIILGGSFLSLIGVILGHWVADLVTTHTFFLTATSLIGFIALMGISSRNSLLLIDYAMGLIKEQGVEKKRAIALASATRAIPIFLTAVAIILGSALLAGDPIFGGLGVALISGTIAAVFVSLLFVPVLMDNADAMMPDDYVHPPKKSGKFFETLSSLFVAIFKKIGALFSFLIGKIQGTKKKEEEK
ncbi:MAG: Acriflavin resistance protein [uncultured Sulfurovum sp.]|uniref:Acriflavin resistance protein n=1 Tax=uncultured Sulfurovum sp. TaxID=269237 RepID=A0A6S6T240_9BACT|nr:MAG: Acriflavin resistance protein [uncultured Sulfurovum sp.]